MGRARQTGRGRSKLTLVSDPIEARPDGGRNTGQLDPCELAQEIQRYVRQLLMEPGLVVEPLPPSLPILAPTARWVAASAPALRRRWTQLGIPRRSSSPRCRLHTSW
jgi:hypothetical protein